MDNNTTALIVAIIGAAGGIIAAIIETRKKVSKDIEELSTDLPSWKLLYEHDANGNPLKGKIDDLCDAINQAYQIKVKIYRAPDHFEMMDAQWLFVDGKIVNATNIEQISLVRKPDGNYLYSKDAYHYYVIVNTNGHHHASRVFIDGRKGRVTDETRRMGWYGLIPPH